MSRGKISKQTPASFIELADLPLNFAKAEVTLVRRALEQAQGNVSQAARLLGIDRNKIYRILAREKDSENTERCETGVGMG